EQSLKNLPWSFRETVHLGRINENLIKSMVNTCRRKPFVLVCGSVTFNEDMCLKAIGEKEGVVNGLEVQRAYTPIACECRRCYKTGLMSQYIKSWKTGDTIFWRGPFGGFPYTANQYGELLMLASGTGIAPMLPIIQYITENEDDETFVTLIGCFRTFENIYMKALLQEQSRFWNIRTFYVLSQEQSLKNLPWSFRETVHLGRINENLIKSMVNTCRRKPFVLVCGSVTFNEDMEKCLKAIGFEKESYFIF
ncbi:hypothetical protein E2320_022923, partial [Naja naja]